ncbi:MAG: ribosome silencing factor [Treponema sp.]|nr:ribosome silencing factor [Treponema sp.]
MEDMSPAINKNTAASVAELLREHKGLNVSLLDLRGICNWSDYFIIATVTSKTHMDGLGRHLKIFCGENNIDFSGSSGKNPDDEWRLIDLGNIIIHLMTPATREFYDLERLWAPIDHPKDADLNKSKRAGAE